MNQLTDTYENTEERRRTRTDLNKFEKLIHDAIALLIRRGEISISRNKRPPPAIAGQTGKR